MCGARERRYFFLLGHVPVPSKPLIAALSTRLDLRLQPLSLFEDIRDSDSLRTTRIPSSSSSPSETCGMAPYPRSAFSPMIQNGSKCYWVFLKFVFMTVPIGGFKKINWEATAARTCGWSKTRTGAKNLRIISIVTIVPPEIRRIRRDTIPSPF